MNEPQASQGHLSHSLNRSALIAILSVSAFQSHISQAEASSARIPFIQSFDGRQSVWTAKPFPSTPQVHLQQAKGPMRLGPLIFGQSETLELRFPEGDTQNIRERLGTPETNGIPFDQLARAGFGQASLIVKSPWITMRYLGERPAGYQLDDPDFAQAALHALGNPNDVLPVTTAAQVVHDMMESYFAPLLRSVPGGQRVLSGLHIQGAYFSTTYNPPDDFRLDFDNAFIVGLQTLIVYPSSCLQRPDPAQCKPPYLSTGHDPTVIGHELGHVIFNRMRAARSLKGYQWFAVNEGYADYFSASYHESPLIGDAWQSSRLTAPYLRRLTDDPSIRDPKVLASAHAFSVVWSSLLWRIRTALIESGTSSRSEFDRAVLLSIAHLGEGGGSRLGDAATALLKAVHESGHFDWDGIVHSAFRQAGVELVAEELALAPSQGSATDGTEPVGTRSRRRGFGCTAQASAQNDATPSSDGLGHELPDMAFLVLTSVFLRSQQKRRARMRVQTDSPHSKTTAGLHRATLSASCLIALLCTACVRQQEQKRISQLIQLRGPALVYQCNWSFFGGSTDLSFVEVNWAVNDRSSTDLVGLLFDPTTELPSAALQVHIDAALRRIDRFLGLDGKPVQSLLTPGVVTKAEAQQLTLLTFALAILEEAPRARISHKETDLTVPQAEEDQVTFQHRNRSLLTADFSQAVTGPGSYGPLPSALKEGNKQICTLVSRRE